MSGKKLTSDAKLEKKLSTGIVAFTYRKTDGSIRYAAGTTDLSLVPAVNQPKAPFVTGKATIAYYDFIKMNVRSLKRDSIIAIRTTITK